MSGLFNSAGKLSINHTSSIISHTGMDDQMSGYHSPSKIHFKLKEKREKMQALKEQALLNGAQFDQPIYTFSKD